MMMRRCPECGPRNTPTTPFYKVTLIVSTSVPPDTGEFITTLHQRIKGGYYTFEGAKRLNE